MRDPPRPLAGTLPCGDRTFLSLARAAIHSTPADISLACGVWDYDVDVGTRTLLSVEEFERLADDGNLHELDEGELIVTPPQRSRHGFVQSAITEALRQAARRANGGIVLTETGFRLAPETIRAPDVALVREQHRSEIAWDGYSDFSPDLAVEILSPEDNASRVQKKIGGYVEAGSTTVWLVDPETVTVSVYHRCGTFRTLKADDEIDFPELLGDWRFPVRTLFE